MSSESKSTRSRWFGRLVILILVATAATYYWGKQRNGESASSAVEVPAKEGTASADGVGVKHGHQEIAVVPTADLSEAEVLVESFEWGRGEVITWAGGNVSREHATEGKQSYRVSLDVRTREFKCRPNAIQPDFSRHRKLLMDTFGPSGPFYVTFTLTDADRQQKYTYPPAQVAAGASTLEFDLRLPAMAGFDLTRVGELRFGRTLTAREVEGFFDNVRLAREGVATYEFFDEPPAEAGEQEPGFVPDGEFSHGLQLWGVERLPGSRWTLSLLRGDGAWKGGPSLALHARNEGGVELISPDLELAPGRYVARYRAQSYGEVQCGVTLREEVPGNWVVVSGKGNPYFPVGAEWEEREIPFHVLPPKGGADDPDARRVMNLVVTVTGKGDCLIDSIRLESSSAEVREPMVPQVYEVPRALYRDGAPVAWNSLRGSFPIFYHESAHLVHESDRVFRTFSGSLGLLAAVDLGALIRSRMPGAALELVDRRKDDAGVGAWLLTKAADWSLAHVPVGLLRGLNDRLNEIDQRLVAIGLEYPDPSGLFRHGDAAGALVVGHDSGARDQKELWNFERALRTASDVVQVTGGAFLARAAVTDRSLPQKAFLARIHGASGMVLEPPMHSMVSDRVWKAAAEVVNKSAEITQQLEGASDLSVKTSHNDVRARGFRIGERALLVVVSLWPQALDEVSFETELGNRTVNLEAWETTVLELGEEK